MANIGYALDETASSIDNKVTEQRVLTSKVADGRCFVVPKVSPFYESGVVVSSGGNVLVKDVDYQLILLSPELTERLGQPVYGGILFHKLSANNIVTITAQTPGGDFNLPLTNTVESLVRALRNPFYTTLSQIVGTPTGLPTYSHIQDWSTTQDFDQMVNKLNLIYLALLSKGGASSGNDSLFLTALNNHINSTTGHTPAQVGLGKVQNLPLAVYNDFIGPTYTNEAYVTPKTVLYAIKLYIGSQITDLNNSFNTLSESVSTMTQNWQSVQNSWVDLKVSLNSVNENYSSLLRQVQSYQTTLDTLNQNYLIVQQNQTNWQNKLSEISQQLDQYAVDYNNFTAARDSIMNTITTLTTAYNNLMTSYNGIIDSLTAVTNRVTKIESASIYPTGTKAISAGDYRFRIRPNEKFNIILIGAGGGVGDYVTQNPSLTAQHLAENGGSSSLWCLTSVANGEALPNTTPVAIAGGGFAGQSSYGDSSGNVNNYGLGGRGGAFNYISNAITVNEASAGDGGFIGSGVYSVNNLSAQDTGYDFYGSKWGKGAIGPVACGQGGEGAKMDFIIENKTTYELEYVIKVGERGRSYDPTKNNSTGGLAIITKI